MVLNTIRNVPFLLVLLLMGFINIGLGFSNPYIIISIYLAYIGWLYFVDKRFLLKYIYIIFYITTNIFGVFLIESNHFFLTELLTYSKNNNSITLITFAQVTFLETMRILHMGVKDKIRSNVNSKITFYRLEFTKLTLVKISIFIILTVFLILFLRVIDKPFFVVKLDRFLYKENYLTPIVETISNTALYLTPIFAMYFFYTRKKLAIIPLLLIVVYLFWIGHKFSVFIVMFYIIILPFVNKATNKSLNNIFKSFIAIFLILLTVVTIQSYVVYQRDFEHHTQYLNQRLAQQGQLWWAIYGLTENSKGHLDEIDDELKTYFKLSIEEDDLYNSGIYKIMRLTTPQDLLVRKIEEQNTRYAYSTHASIYYYFKEIGVIIFSIISGILYFFIVRGVVNNISNLKIIQAVLYARLLFISHTVLLQSDFHNIFSIEVILIIYILLVMSLFERLFTHIEKPKG